MSKEVTKAQTTAISAPLDQIAGLEGFESDMLIVPRLKIVQQMSVEVTELGIRPGTLVNSLTKEELAGPAEPVEIVPLMISRSRLLFRDMEEGGGIACSARDGKHGEGEPGGSCKTCPLSQWTDDKPPACTEFINIPMIPLVGDMQPLVAAFGKTSYKVGKLFANMMVMKRQSPWFFKYEISTKFIEDKKGKYFVYQVKPAGLAPEEMVQTLEESYRLLASTAFVADFDEEEIKTEQAQMSDVVNEDDLPY